jgi:hypothetical protein
MFHMSLIHNPDHSQTLEHHQELLAEAEQERLAQEAMKARQGERLASHARGFLRHLFHQHPSRRLKVTVSHPGVHTR